jgi:hypothetical protein
MAAAIDVVETAGIRTVRGEFMEEIDKTLPALDQLNSLRGIATSYFQEAIESTRDSYIKRDSGYWNHLNKGTREKGMTLLVSLGDFAKLIGPAIRRAPLLTEADERKSGHAIKGMRAAVRMKSFRYWDPEILHDEGTVLGMQPAGEDETDVNPAEAQQLFGSWADELHGRVEMMSAAGSQSDSALIEAKPIAAGYRPGTAFIMTWMAKDHPELTDLSNTVKRCFEKFGITASRSDDIEHEDVITQKILDQIKTAEFLFADLSGERPSVYYEVGFAHALGRRVIMFRKSPTQIHFDLAAYNCPEYQHYSELEDKLTKRLEHVTGKVPRKA